MAILKGNNQLSGRIGDRIYRQTRYGTVVCLVPQKPATPMRSEKQMRNRTQIVNLYNNCRLYNDAIDTLFEDKAPSHTNYNVFVQLNHGRCPVYLTKQEVAARACVVAPYQFSRGLLRPIGYELNTEGILRSNLSLGKLEVGKDTTVADLSEALIHHNAGWQEGDLLVFLHVEQFTDRTGTPRAKLELSTLTLDTTDHASAQRLAEQQSPLGFSSIKVPEPVVAEPGRSIEGPFYLGMNTPLVSGGAAWLHLRFNASGKAQLSSQWLAVVNPLLELYRSDEAFRRAAASYGTQK